MELLWIGFVYAAFLILGGGGLVFWMKRQFNVMREIIGSQREHLQTLATHTDTLKGVLESTDEPQMLERLQAYKQFVDREAEARIRDAERQYKQAAKETANEVTSEVVREGLKDVGVLIGAVVQLIMKVVPYVPPQRRQAVVAGINFPHVFNEVKEVITKGIMLAPDASTGLAQLLWTDVAELSSVEIERRARVAKARADVRMLASAVSQHTAHTGSLPGGLADLTEGGPAINVTGQSRGPIIKEVPAPPEGWTPYVYTPRPGGNFTINTSGDGETVVAP